MVAVVPQAIAFYIFAKYIVFKDSYENRNHLMLACGMMALANGIEYAGIIAGVLFSPNIPFQALLIYLSINGVNVLVYIYFYVICQQWAEMISNNL